MSLRQIPFFRPDIGESEIEEVVETLRSGWLTSGARVRLFEKNFASAVDAPYAVALNSCTAALHLAVDALGLKPGQGVLVPTMTFAATAEVVRYLGAIPILVDCDRVTGNMDLRDCELRIEGARGKGQRARSEGQSAKGREESVEHQPQMDADQRGFEPRPTEIVGIMPVHVGGLMMDMKRLKEFAQAHNLWIVEDAAHAFPAAWREQEADGRRQTAGGRRWATEEANEWQKCGQMGDGERRVVCFSFYANKTITTGEGGMAVTGDAELADRMRLMSLHGLSQDAWERYSGGSSWDYRIVAPGFKYNLTDIAAAIGIHQLARAEEMRCQRERIARCYLEAFAGVAEIELPPEDANRIHAWHLFPIRLRLEKLKIDRNQFIEELKQQGVGCSVHWRPLHLHPYYQETFGWRPEQFPAATAMWRRLISLAIYPGMNGDEIEQVINTVKGICKNHAIEGIALYH
jgi:dTDP-4-amino-4,6-dideoxygalactose transaminase